MTHNRCLHEPDWPLFVLGTMEPGPRQALQRHLDEGCSQCRATEREWREELIPFIGLSAPEAHPSPEVEAKLALRLKGKRQRAGRDTSYMWPAGLLTAASLAFGIYIYFHAAAMAMLNAEEDAKLRRLQVENKLLRAQAPVPPAASVPTFVPPALPAAPATPHATVRSSQSGLNELAEQKRSLELRLTASEQRAAAMEKQLREQDERALEQQRAQSEIIANNQEALDTARHRLESAEGEAARLRSELDRNAEGATANPIPKLPSPLAGERIHSVQLRPVDPAASGASARVITGARSGLIVVAEHMPALPPTKCYQLWLIRKGSPSIISGGIFQTDRSGTALLTASDIPEGAPITGFAITDEPAGGSVSARGHKLLFGAYR